MQTRLVGVFIAITLIILVPMISGASASNTWTKSEHPPYVRHTATNPGSVKICGNHICAPFETTKPPVTKSITSFYTKQNNTTVEKIFVKTPMQTKLSSSTKK